MSFKRDGDDAALLRNLKMRRVGELLGDHIPDDEATLLRNGRLCCTICIHRPIFDTTATLAVHRKGKRHINELSKFLAHKRELEMKQQKMDHKNSMQAERKPLQPDVVQRNGKNGSSQPYSRKIVLDVPQLEITKTNKSSAPSAQSQVRQYLKTIWKKQALEKTVERLRENYGENAESTAPVPESPKETEATCEKTTTVASVDQCDDEAKRKAAEHHLQMKMSGWIKDADGKWLKDPNVEFDSDEEEPDVPPT